MLPKTAPLLFLKSVWYQRIMFKTKNWNLNLLKSFTASVPFTAKISKYWMPDFGYRTLYTVIFLFVGYPVLL